MRMWKEFQHQSGVKPKATQEKLYTNRLTVQLQNKPTDSKLSYPAPVFTSTQTPHPTVFLLRVSALVCVCVPIYAYINSGMNIKLL